MLTFSVPSLTIVASGGIRRCNCNEKMASTGMNNESFGAGDQGGEEFQSKSQDPKVHLKVHTGKPTRLQVKVAIPIKEFPNFNFVGKLLGPKGASLKQLQEATQTRMAILGRGSMRDKKKEEELRNGGEVKYSHLNDELHVEISAFAPPGEAYRRVAHALDELSRIFVPDDSSAPPYPPGPQGMSVNGRGMQKPGGFGGYEDPMMGGARPPPGGPVPPTRGGGAGYWSPARGAASGRGIQPRPGAASAVPPRRAPFAAGGGDSSYDDSYGGYGAGGAAGGGGYDSYAEGGMGGDGGYAANDYSGDPSHAGPARGYAGRGGRPYAAAAGRPY